MIIRLSFYIVLFLFLTQQIACSAEFTESTFKEAEQEYSKHNYKEALSLYKDVVDKEQNNTELKKQAGLKILYTLKILSDYDELLNEFDKYVELNPNTIYQARAYHFGATLYQDITHFGYKRDNKLYRNEDHREGEYVYTYNEDIELSFSYFTKAKDLYYKLIPNSNEAKEETIKLNFDLANFLKNGYYSLPITKFETEDSETYNSNWEKEKQIIFLYDEVLKLNETLNKPSYNAKAIFEKAVFIANKKFNQVESEKKQVDTLEDPMKLLWSVVNDYSKDELAPEALFTIAEIYYNHDQNYISALEIYQDLINKYPESKRVEDCKFRIQELNKTSLSQNIPSTVQVNTNFEISVYTKNLEKVTAKIYSIDLASVLKQNVNNPSRYFINFQENIGHNLKDVKRYYKNKVSELEIKTDDKKDYKTVYKNVKMPKLSSGTYLVELKGKNLTTVSVILVSNISIIENFDSNKAIIYVLDKTTGYPIKDANVVIKESFYENNNYKSIHKEIKTTKDGLVYYEKKNKDASNSYIEAFAYKDKDIAITNYEYYYSYYSQDKLYKGYVYTDRPVYRPEQKVNFKEIIYFYENGEYKTVVDKNVSVRVVDTKGKEIYKKTLKTNKFGSVNDSLMLKKGSALGDYNIYTSVLENGEEVSYSGNSTFKVEEYKKPEYLVSVSSEDKQLKQGDKAKFKINATYYFGSPVKDAKVSYKVMRKAFYYYYYRPSYYSWIYDSYNNNFSDSQLIKQGELVTDEKGNAFVQFDTDKGEQDYTYKVLVTVTDKSRRNIDASGSINVTKTAFYAFVDVDRGFYSPDERVNVEINLKTPSGEAVETKGKLKVCELKQDDKTQKYIEKEILSLDKKSDKDGKIYYKWKAPKEGYFRIKFEGYDKYENLVTGQKEIWVTDENFNGKHFYFKDIEIITDKKTYEEGETARIMLNCNYADSYIILFEEAGNSILSHKILYLPNKSTVIETKITKKHIPNFDFKAVLIKNNLMFMDTKEIFVPPTNQFLNIELKTKKDTYLPREKGVIEIKTTDNNGKPVSSEIALGVTDSSVYYIQSDNSQDIRSFYYGEKRYVQQYIRSSLNAYIYFNLSEDTETYKNYDFHQSQLYLYRDNYPKLKDGFGFATQGAVPMPMAELAMDAAPVSPKAMTKRESVSDDKSKFKEIKDDEIRSYFPDTALWQPTITTDKKGLAKVDITFPDSLTDWRITAKASDENCRVTNTSSNVITKKNLLVRLQAPRFFVEKDEILISAIVNNNLAKEKKVKCVLEATKEISILSKTEKIIYVKGNSEKRIDWKVKVLKEGNVKITVKAMTSLETDAMQLNFPVYIHGIEKTVSKNGVLKTETKADIPIQVPAERKIGSSDLTITLSPSMITSVLEALPYLASYPYGCVEQTTSRFIPTVLVAKTLRTLGIDISKIESKTKELNAEELAIWIKRKENPVYSLNKINEMVSVGLKRLYSFQNSDGGFGWWNGSTSDPYMTSYVLNGLILAKQSDYSVDNNILDKGLYFLKKEFNKLDDSYYNKLYIAYVLSMEKKITVSDLETFFYNRDIYNNYGKALLSLAYANLGDKEKAELICQNLKSFVIIDKQNDTASWGNDEKAYWYWYSDLIETNAFVLKAFLQSRPNDALVPQIAKWLILNRNANHWNSTKDTANAINALSEFAKMSKELDPNYTVSILYNGKAIKKIKVTKDNLLSFENKITLTDKELSSGDGKLSIIKEGNGNLYYSAYLSYFTLEEDVKGSGNEISVKREYFKVTEKKDKNNKIDYVKTPIAYMEDVKSGDTVEVKLTLNSNNNYEYLIVEDMKPSGFEAIDLTSGYVYQNGIYLYKELRDEKVIFFLNYLSQGTQVITYKLRAEIPGKFHVLPNKTEAMYAPRVKAISDEMRIGTVDWLVN